MSERANEETNDLSSWVAASISVDNCSECLKSCKIKYDEVEKTYTSFGSLVIDLEIKITLQSIDVYTFFASLCFNTFLKTTPNVYRQTNYQKHSNLSNVLFDSIVRQISTQSTQTFIRLYCFNNNKQIALIK